jgi:hypothetical protein
VNNKFKISNATSNQIRLITEVIKIVIPKAMELTNSTGDRAEIDQAYTLSLASAVQSFGYSNQFFTGEEKDREFKTIWSGIAASIFKLTSSNFKDVIEELKGIDTEVQNSSLSAEDKVLLYRAISIARYSSAYWISESLNSNS